jgi:quinol monooxygenase YgiN
MADQQVASAPLLSGLVNRPEFSAISGAVGNLVPNLQVNHETAIRTKGAGGASDGVEEPMSRVSIWAQLEAKPGKEKDLEEFLKSAQPLAEREPETISWYAIKMGPGKYGIFDTFADEHGRNAHLNGDIAKALFAKAKDLLAKPPEISKPEILAVKS